MLCILNFNGIGYGNTIPKSEHIVVKINGDVKNVRILNFMEGWKNVNVSKDENYSIIRLMLHTQAVIIYETNETINLRTIL